MSLSLDQIPTPKSERWKYTNLPRVLKKMDLRASSLGWGADVALLNPQAPGALLYKDTQLWDINSRDTKDIRFVTQDDDIAITAKDGEYLSPRLVIHVKDGQEMTLIERHDGEGAYWKNAVTQIVVGKNARLRHYRFFDETEASAHSAFVHVKIARDARYEGFSLIEGAGLLRNQIHAEMHGENAYCGLGGVNLLSGSQHADTTITIEHQAPHGQSRQNYKSVLKDSAHGVFQGKVHVHQIAQKTDGYQLSNTLILSPTADMDTKPELEIYADDVKCSHGATTGKLDEEPLFYLQSRGIPEAKARALLIEAFCGEALSDVADEVIQDQLRGRISAWLNTR